jgi:hypothetical protein
VSHSRQKTGKDNMLDRQSKLDALTAVALQPVVSQPEILHAYLLRNIRAGVIDFAIRAEEQPGATVKFYIHPAHESGDTLDFLLWDDPENGYDLLMNEQQCPKPDPEKFRKLLRARLANVSLSDQGSANEQPRG